MKSEPKMVNGEWKIEKGTGTAMIERKKRLVCGLRNKNTVVLR